MLEVYEKKMWKCRWEGVIVSLQEWSSVRWGTVGAAAAVADAREEAASAARTREKSWNTSNDTRTHYTPDLTPTQQTIRGGSSSSFQTHWVRTGSHFWEAESPVPVPGGWEVEAGDAERGVWSEGRSALETGSRRSDRPALRSCSAEDFLPQEPWARPPWAERSCQPDWPPPDRRSNSDSGRSAGAGWRRRGSAEEEECSGRRGRSYCGMDYQKGAPGTRTKKIIWAI